MNPSTDGHQSIEPKGIPKKNQVPIGIITFFVILLFSKYWHFSLFIIAQFRLNLQSSDFKFHFTFVNIISGHIKIPYPFFKR